MDFYIKGLKESDQLELLSTCIANISEILIITSVPEHDNAQPKVLYVNEAFTKLTGYSRDEIYGQSPKILHGKDTCADTLKKIRQAMTTRQSLKTEILNYKKNGEPYWIEFSLQPIQLNHIESSYFLGISVDITAHKRATKHLQEKQESLRFVLESSDLGYWDLDIVQNQTKRSLKHDQLFGHLSKKSAWSYDNFLSQVHKDDRDRVNLVFQKAMQESGDYDVEFRCVWPNGDIKWLWSKGRFIHDEDGQVVRAAGIQADITDKKLTEFEIKRLAFEDSLTGLPNKTDFYRKLEHIRETTSRDGQYCALLILDVDNFKTINDTLGHEIGDQVLLKVAYILSENHSLIETLARIGGDEFAIITKANGCNKEQVQQNVRSLYQNISTSFERFIEVGEHRFYLTNTVGVRLFSGTSDSISDIVKQADLAMHQAKAEGKNKLKYFDAVMQEKLTQKLELEKELHEILETNELYVVYQPKNDQYGSLIGFEALLRWEHPKKGSISPIDFIPVAEECGAIIAIGDWVLNKVCSDVERWCKQYPDLQIKVSVNISAVQFSYPNILQQIIKANNKLQWCHSKLMLEITEQTLIEDVAQSVRLLEKLIAEDISCSLDDFGTGYSSLYYLKMLPIHDIKIDRSFIRDILDDENDAAIIAAVVGIAEKLGVTLIAEGVETDEQLSVLIDMGCKQFQGFLFSKPLIEKDTRKYIAKHLALKPPVSNY